MEIQNARIVENAPLLLAFIESFFSVASDAVMSSFRAQFYFCSIDPQYDVGCRRIECRGASNVHL